MPFTPLHMGPGMAAKAAAGRHFSIVVFGLTQIAVDVEVLCHLWLWEPPFHRFWHTYLGVTIITVAAAVVGKPASQWIKGVWNWIAARCRDTDLSVAVETTWVGSLTGAVFGGYSHIIIDSMHHPEIAPFQPWSASNRLRGIVSPFAVEAGCIFLGVAGFAWFVWTERKRRKTIRLPDVAGPSRVES